MLLLLGLDLSQNLKELLVADLSKDGAFITLGINLSIAAAFSFFFVFISSSCTIILNVVRRIAFGTNLSIAAASFFFVVGVTSSCAIIISVVKELSKVVVSEVIFVQELGKLKVFLILEVGAGDLSVVLLAVVRDGFDGSGGEGSHSE